MPNNLAVSYGQPSGYPNPTFFLGNFSTDPVNTSPGQWWYNTTSMEIKGNINGTVQILAAFASSFSSTTYITNDTTIGGQGITVNYIDLVITNNATLTIAAGSNVNVAGLVNVTAGATLVMQGAMFNVYNTLQNAGTVQSTSSSDSIQAVQVQNTGVMQIDGTLYLPSAGYNHILAGTVSGTGTLNIQGSAITLIGDQLSLSISTVNGSGTYQVQQNGVCTINGNIAMSLANVTGTGSVSVASGYTLTFSGSNLLPTTLTVSGTLALSGNYTLVTNIPNVKGSLVINSGYTLTVASNITLGFTSVGGSGTLSVSSGYTLTISANSTFSISTVSGAGTLSVSSGYTLYVSTTFNIANVTGAGTISTTGSTYIGANSTWSIATIAGQFGMEVNSGVTVNQGAAMTWSIVFLGIYGTWNNNGYGITLTDSNMNIIVAGSFTTASTPGTLTVNGTAYWRGNITPQTSNAVPTFIMPITGTGILIVSPTGTRGTATTSISLSSTAIAANAGDGSASGSGKIPYMTFSSVTGSAIGKYGIGIYDSTAATYAIFLLIYVGGTSAYSISSNFYHNYTVADTSGHTIEVFNASDSAGTITLTGMAYV